MAIVRRRFIDSPRSHLAVLRPGELVWASVINGLENPLATGKARPVVLVAASGSQWQAMGLTTNSRYRDGGPRVAIPNHGMVGLRGPGWLWGNRLCRTTVLDISDHIGWVDESLALRVVELAALPNQVATALLDAARRHHGFPPSAVRSQMNGDAS